MQLHVTSVAVAMNVA